MKSCRLFFVCLALIVLSPPLVIAQELSNEIELSNLFVNRVIFSYDSAGNRISRQATNCLPPSTGDIEVRIILGQGNRPGNSPQYTFVSNTSNIPLITDGQFESWFTNIVIFVIKENDICEKKKS